MTKQEAASVFLYFALTATFLIQSVVHLQDSQYIQSAIYGALGVANVFVTFAKFMKFSKVADI